MRLIVVFALILFLGDTCPSVSGPVATYQMRIKPHHTDGAVLLSIYNRHSGKTIWRCDGVDPMTMGWSKDHSVLFFPYWGGKWPTPSKHSKLAAAIKSGSDYDRLSAGIWHVGQRRPIRYNKWLFYPGFDMAAYYFDVKWSSDNRLVAFRTTVSDGVNQDEGDLWCLEANTGRLWHTPDQEMVGPYKWVGRGRIAYKKRGLYKSPYVAWKVPSAAPNFTYWQVR